MHIPFDLLQKYVCRVWVVFSIAIGLSTLAGLVIPIFVTSDVSQLRLQELIERASSPAVRTLILYMAATSLQILLSLLIVSYIGSPSPTFGVVLVLPFSVGVVAPATIARAFLQPALSDTLVARCVSPLDSGHGVAVVAVLFDTWQWIGLLVVALGLQLRSVVPHCKDVAAVEGFSRMQMIRWLIIPACKSVLLIYSALKLLDWLKKEDLIRSLVGELGGHANQTTPLFLSRWYYSGNEVQAPLAVVGILTQLFALLLLVWMFLRVRIVRRVLGAS